VSATHRRAVSGIAEQVSRASKGDGAYPNADEMTGAQGK